MLFFLLGIISGDNKVPPPGQITINGALLLISAMLMIADTYKSHKQWLRKSKQDS